MGSATPTLLDGLITFARTNTSDALVSYGKAVSSEPGDYLMVGVDNPANVEQRAVVSSQNWPYAGGQTRHEWGEIYCTAESVNGDAGDEGQQAACAAVYALISRLESAIRGQKDLGLSIACEFTFGSVSELTFSQDSNGSRATLGFRLAFQAWTTT